MIYEKARELARMLAGSGEFAEYARCKEQLEQDDATQALLKEFKQLQYQAQAAGIAGRDDRELQTRLMKLAEILQFHPDAAEYLQAEFRLNRMLADVFKLLADAVGMDLGYTD